MKTIDNYTTTTEEQNRTDLFARLAEIREETDLLGDNIRRTWRDNSLEDQINRKEWLASYGVFLDERRQLEGRVDEINRAAAKRRPIAIEAN